METIPIDKIIADPEQPRKYFPADKMGRLVNSINKHGIKSPITVFKEGNEYVIEDGERRWRAAKELKLKNIPAFVVAKSDYITRIIEQFHIQEMHEGWTPIEKAKVLIRLADELKKPLKEVCELLGISYRTAQSYVALAKIQNVDLFTTSGCPIEYAMPIGALKGFVKKLKAETLEENFNLTDQRTFEKVVIKNISDGTDFISKGFLKAKGFIQNATENG